MLNVENGVITLTRGDSAYLNFRLTTQDGEAYQLQEGDLLRLTVRAQADSSCPVLLEAESTDETILLKPEQTEQLEPGKYSYDVQLQTAAGDVFTILGATGVSPRLKNFVICPEVTV